MIKRLLLPILVSIIGLGCHAQSYVSITIDDVPNAKLVAKSNNKSILLHKLDSMKVPTAIFINEKLLHSTPNLIQNQKLLEQWISNPLITAGNHTFKHSRCSATSNKDFETDIRKGDKLTKEYAEKFGKTVKHFRFPYNDLGKDSTQQARVKKILHNLNYQITPFTIESSDWMFNYLYEYFLKKKDHKKAEQIANSYISQTLKNFHYFDSLAINQYNRPIKHIYLCHDNRLNADHLPTLLEKLKEKEYQFISLDEALTDKVYQQENLYNKKWGISWVYRWMPNQKERVRLMKAEPEMMDIYELYQKISKSNANY
jgi:peptidoglycan/xylan/chitin deacetylase (PgdA/CDA1 family)